jgi:tetratricopeptide (TPR) repeat protein
MIREQARVPELEYIFKHHLTQEAAYNGLLRRERPAFHRQVAEALERLFPGRVEEQLGLLAHHWERAEERDKALHYLQRAGEQAAAQYANAESVAYFSRALDLTPEEDLAERYALLLARERLYAMQVDREAQREDLAALQEVGEALGDDARRAEVALLQARYAHHLPDYPAAIAAAERAVRLARAADDVRTEAAGYQRWAAALLVSGDYSGSRSRLERAITLARAAHLRRVEAASLRSLATGLGEQGDHAGARALYEQALGIYREIGDRRQENVARLSLGAAAQNQGDYDEARVCYEQALRVFREIGDRWHEAFAHSLPGRVYHGLGEYGRARAHYEQYLRGCRQTGDRRGVAFALCWLGLVSHREGDDEVAHQYAKQALQMAHDQGERSYRGAIAICLGNTLVGLARFDEATETYRQSLALLRELDRPRYAIEALAGLSRVCMAQGDLSQARAHVEDILSYLQDHTLGNVFLLEAPMHLYLTCYQVLQANVDTRAQNILVETYHRLQERAAKISDEGERRSFLENVAANREIVETYERWRGDMKGE